MTQKNSELQELLNALEVQRELLHPEISPDLIREILVVEAEHAEDESRALSAITALLDDHLTAGSEE